VTTLTPGHLKKLISRGHAALEAGRIFCVAFPPSTTLEAAVVLVRCLFVLLNRGLRILEHSQ
jgi:hypothetical protein